MIPKFPQTSPSFYSELKARVNRYFDETGQRPTGNFKLYSKAIFLVAGLISVFVMLLVIEPNWVWGITGSILLGLLIAAIGFNVMHDGSHGSFSRYPWVNTVAAYTLNILGGSAFMWNMKHCVIHHAYTNVHEVDDDLDAGILLRLSKHQRYMKFHRFQHWYFWILYSQLYIFWIFASDYMKYFTGKIGDVPLKKMAVGDHFRFWVSKVLHAFIFIILPIMVLGIGPWAVGFIVMASITGFCLSIVFQLAHTVEHTQFPTANPTTGKMEDEWAVHQLKTTANFATRNKLVSWLVGGLNFQVEHHLFPRISHIHYPAINRIVKKACAEYNIPYVEYPRMYQAVHSHVNHLKRLAKG
jgi:linoleoyl-CoA desaturase